jgi:predicted ester cyclase
MGRSPATIIRAANTALIVEGDLDAVGDYFTPSDMTGGHDVIRGFVGSLRRAFPDVAVEVEILVEAGDRVAWRRTLRATHLHAFRGFPATGRVVVWRDMVTSRLQEGLIAEDWSISDLAERLLLARKG